MKWKQSEFKNSEKNNDNCCLFIKNVFLIVSDVSARQKTIYNMKIANDTSTHKYKAFNLVESQS